MFRTDKALKAFREEQNLRQIDLAAKAGVNQPTISAIEGGADKLNQLENEFAMLKASGATAEELADAERRIKRAERSPTIRTLERLCKALDISLLEFFQWTDK